MLRVLTFLCLGPSSGAEVSLSPLLGRILDANNKKLPASYLSGSTCIMRMADNRWTSQVKKLETNGWYSTQRQTPEKVEEQNRCLLEICYVEMECSRQVVAKKQC